MLQGAGRLRGCAAKPYSLVERLMPNQNEQDRNQSGQGGGRGGQSDQQRNQQNQQDRQSGQQDGQGGQRQQGGQGGQRQQGGQGGQQSQQDMNRGRDDPSSSDERGHLQATGRDAKGRKQYRYHPRWRELRDADKFEHLTQFAAALPRIRRQVRADMAAPGLPRRKVLALLVELLERTCIRIGNERYAEENDSFGLTTMRNRHVRVNGARVEFQFRGKSGKFHRIRIDDPQLARIVRHCRDLPGQELFQYQDEAGEVQSVGSSDVNDYLKEIAGCDV